MPDPDDPSESGRGSLLRRVARFVTHPLTDWRELQTRPPEDALDSTLARGALQAMLERKRHHDFVRKREFDALRRLRREGLSPERLAALEPDSAWGEGPGSPPGGLASRPLAEPAVKAKIDAIERELTRLPGPAAGASTLLPLPELPTLPGGLPLPAATAGPLPLPVLDAAAFDAVGPGPEVLDLGHDSLLDEAAIAYASGDDEGAIAALQRLIAPGGERRAERETWHALADLLRATGRREAYDAFAVEHRAALGRPAPPWPGEPAEVAGEGPAWRAPARLDAAALAGLDAALARPAPVWTLDSGAVESVDEAGAAGLAARVAAWCETSQALRWIGLEALDAALAAAAPSGDPQGSRAAWAARLQLMRLAQRPDRHDELSIDHCLTFEAAPPAWAPARARLLPEAPEAAPTLLAPSQLPTRLMADAEGPPVAGLVLQGELQGELHGLLAGVAPAARVRFDCRELRRVDFLAAGELLNWVEARRAEGRHVVFDQLIRPVAYFFQAMGLQQHARLRLRED